MAIDGFNKHDIMRLLGQVLSPASAIRTPEHLKGRAANLKEIERALAMPGRYVFIYGDRGVGKTSLALTSAFMHQSSDAFPIIVSCDSETDLFALVRSVVSQAIANPLGEIETKSTEAQVNLKFLSAKKTKALKSGEVPDVETINDCVDLIRYLSRIHSLKPVIVIDEFDRISSKTKKKKFAEFFKKCSDDDVPASFIICGISSSLDDLLGEHLSVARNIASIKLNRLSHDARWEIVNEAATQLGIIIPKDMVTRIGQISDGFPHYVHLVTEKILWSIFDDAKVIKRAGKRHFAAGIETAIRSAEALPRVAYEKATKKHTDDYLEVLWAAADGPHLERQVSDIYDKSYCQIMRYRGGREVIPKQKFYNRMGRLKVESHGEILRSPRRGWVEFSDSVVRGYVRLAAQEEGIEIGDDYFNADDDEV